MTVQHRNRGEGRARIGTAEVADYLRANADFFEHHPELLVDLRVPHPTGGAVSLIERQVAVLRDQNHQLRKQLQDLIGIARDNDRLFARLHQMSLALIEADGLEALLIALYEQLRQHFTADIIGVKLFKRAGSTLDRPELIEPDHPGFEAFAGLMARGKPACGRFTARQLQFMFEDRAAEVKSAAVLPLGVGPDRLGLLGVASYDPARFHAGMSTAFLSHMGEMVAALTGRHVV
jgi:uncharacterized protein YigA (DUF484 family)